MNKVRKSVRVESFGNLSIMTRDFLRKGDRDTLSGKGGKISPINVPEEQGRHYNCETCRRRRARAELLLKKKEEEQNTAKTSAQHPMGLTM